MYPQLKVGINKDFDKVMCLKFLNKQKAGIDFGGGIIKVHPELSGISEFSLEEKTKQIGKYFDKFYKSNQVELESKRDAFLNDWMGISEKFFKLCGKYFNGLGWPEGRYIGFLSIISCNPRFLDEKTFQVFWKNKKGFVPVAVHEMLHFIFYHALSTYYSNIDINSEKVWQISEVFNIIILSQPDFIEITKDSYPDPYPNLVNLQNELEPVWKSTKNIESFLKTSLDIK